MKKRLMDWKTTLAGLGLAILHLLANNPTADPKQIAIAGGVFLLGALSKSDSQKPIE